MQQGASCFIFVTEWSSVLGSQTNQPLFDPLLLHSTTQNHQRLFAQAHPSRPHHGDLPPSLVRTLVLRAGDHAFSEVDPVTPAWAIPVTFHCLVCLHTQFIHSLTTTSWLLVLSQTSHRQDHAGRDDEEFEDHENNECHTFVHGLRPFLYTYLALTVDFHFFLATGVAFLHSLCRRARTCRQDFL